MKKERMMTRADLLLILFLSVAGCLFLFGSILGEAQQGDRWVSVQVNGREVDRLPLRKGDPTRRLVYQTAYGRNVVELENGAVWMAEADCPDLLCIRQGRISRVGAMLVCLPHRFVVEICSEVGSSEDPNAPDLILH